MDFKNLTSSELDYELSKLNVEQLGQLIEAVEARKVELAEEAKSKICPRCGSDYVRKHGYTGSGSRRLRCFDCGKTWTVDKHFICTRLNDKYATILVTGLINNLPIRELGDSLGVSVSTAYKYKIQVCEILMHKYKNDLGKTEIIKDFTKEEKIFRNEDYFYHYLALFIWQKNHEHLNYNDKVSVLKHELQSEWGKIKDEALQFEQNLSNNQ